MSTEIHQKTWGYETWLVNIPKYCGKILTVWQNRFCSLHCHKIKEETFYVLKGAFEITQAMGGLDQNQEPIEISGRSTWFCEEGAVIHVPQLMFHRFKGLKVENQLVEISSEHFETDSYRVEPSWSAP